MKIIKLNLKLIESLRSSGLRTEERMQRSLDYTRKKGILERFKTDYEKNKRELDELPAGYEGSELLHKKKENFKRTFRTLNALGRTNYVNAVTILTIFIPRSSEFLLQARSWSTSDAIRKCWNS